MSTEPTRTFYKVIANPKTGRPKLVKAKGIVLHKHAKSALGKTFVQFTGPTPLADFGKLYTTTDKVHLSAAQATAAHHAASVAEYKAAKDAADRASHKMRHARQFAAIWQHSPAQPLNWDIDTEQPQEPTMQAVGGRARAAKLSPDRRKEIAQKAAQARWALKRNNARRPDIEQKAARATEHMKKRGAAQP